MRAERLYPNNIRTMINNALKSMSDFKNFKRFEFWDMDLPLDIIYTLALGAMVSKLKQVLQFCCFLRV